MINNLNIPKYRTGEVARAIGMRPVVLSRWYDRGLVHPAGCDKPTNGSGDHRLVSARTATKIGIVHALSRLGVMPSKGFELAAQFSDSGQTGREPGALFASGKTLLVISPKGGSAVINAVPGEPTEFNAADVAMIVVDCNLAVAKVSAGLGISAPDTDGTERILRQLDLPQESGAAA